MSLLLLRRHYPELLSNVGFETPGGGGADVFLNWSESAGDGAVARTTTAGEFRSGVAACKITTGPTYNTFIQQNFAVVPGVSYTLNFWSRGDGTNTGRYNVYDITNSQAIISLTSTNVPGTTYALVSRTFQAPAGCILAQIQFVCTSGAGGIGYFDDVSCKRK